MHIARLVGFSAAVLGALATLLFLGPDDVVRFQPIAVEGNQELISEAIEDYDANALAAGEDVELQVVANGWVARDLLYVMANEFDAMSAQLSVLSAQTDAIASRSEPDERVPILLFIATATFAFHAATAPFVRAGWQVSGASRFGGGGSADDGDAHDGAGDAHDADSAAAETVDS